MTILEMYHDTFTLVIGSAKYKINVANLMKCIVVRLISADCR